MNLKDLEEYYDLYIQNYLPYKESNLYKTISKNIIKNYFNDLYNNIPVELKTMFEQRDIPISVTDKLLTGIGVSHRLRSQLSLWEKIVFLQMLSNFQQYKGDMDFLIHVLKVYLNRIGVYELYIDKINPWVFKPELVYKHDLIQLYEDSIPYIEVYLKLPSLLVNEDQLEELKNTDNILLPIKSNIIMIDFLNRTNSSLINDLIVATFLAQYGHITKILYFEDNNFEIDINLFTYVWFYLCSEYYDIEWNKFPLNFILKFNSNEPNYPYTLQDVEKIIDEYDLIDIRKNGSRQKLDDFYNNYFLEPFGFFYQTNNNIKTNHMLQYIQSKNYDLAIYLNKRITSALDRKNELQKMISEIFYLIYYMVEKSDDHYFHKYGIYWVLYLPQIITNVKDTPEYKIIYELKPYHVEILERSQNVVVVEDKFNSILFDEEYNFDLIAGPFVSAEVISSTPHIKQNDDVIIMQDEFEIIEYPEYSD